MTIMNRLAEARKSQGVTVAMMSKFLGIPEDHVLIQEDPSRDLKISELQSWQKALNVPMSDLLPEYSCDLSLTILERARIVRLMSTAVSLREAETVKSTFSQMLIEQIVEIMPELSSMRVLKREAARNEERRVEYV